MAGGRPDQRQNQESADLRAPRGEQRIAGLGEIERCFGG
jgi:hypothetical protein